MLAQIPLGQTRMRPATPPSSAAPDIAPWITEFHSFTVDHAIALGWTVPLVVVSCWLGRRWLGRGDAESVSRERQLCAGWAGFIVCVNVWQIMHFLRPDTFDIRNSLPLHMCDVGLLLAPLLFLTHWRPIRSIMYFWGIGLCTQAFVSPILKEGVGTDRYWLFWLGHLAIVGSAVYDLVVRRYRPTLRDLVVTLAITIAWYVTVLVVNIKLGANYGYNGNVVPDRPTLIDSLGPWPARVYILAGIVIVWFTVLWAIWPVSSRLSGRRG